MGELKNGKYWDASDGAAMYIGVLTENKFYPIVAVDSIRGATAHLKDNVFIDRKDLLKIRKSYVSKEGLLKTYNAIKRDEPNAVANFHLI